MKKANSSVTKIVDVLHCAIGVAGWLLVAGVLPAQAQTLSFDRPSEPVSEPYTTPEEPTSCWKKPGPIATRQELDGAASGLRDQGKAR